MTPARRKIARQELAKITWAVGDGSMPDLLHSALDEIDSLEERLIELACQDPPRGVATGAVRLGPTEQEMDEQAGGRVRRRRKR